MQTIVAVSPEAIAHDLNPDFHSTQVALAMADRFGIPAVAVQHHHAHIAAVLAEHACPTAVLGLALDGYGFGTDGAAWGELLRVDRAGFERVGHPERAADARGDAAAKRAVAHGSVSHAPAWCGRPDRRGRFQASRRRPCWRACSTNRTCVRIDQPRPGLRRRSGFAGRVRGDEL